MDPRIDQAGPAPSEVRDHHGGERPADRAGKPAEQGQGRDGAPRALAIEPAESREGGVVEARAHAGAEDQPGREIDRQCRGEREADQAERQQQRTRRQDRTSAAVLDAVADARRHEAARKQAEGQSPDNPAERPAGIAGDRLRQNRQEIVGRAPGEDLRHPEGRDDDRKAGCFCRRRKSSRGGAAHAATPQPHPDLPSSFATTSATQQASTSAGAGPPQQPARSSTAWVDGDSLRRADAGFGKHQPQIIGCRHIARDCRGDGANLLIAGEEQEGRRAPIALDAHRIEAGLGMGELAVAVRRHGAAGMLVRIDQGTQRLGAFEPGIEIETQLARQRQIGALAGGGDDPIDRADPMPAAGRLAFDDDLPVLLMERDDGEAGHERDAAALCELADFRPQLAARRQLIGVATAIDPHQIGAPGRPNERGLRLGIRELRQLQKRIAGGMSGADDQRRHPGIDMPGAAEDVGDAIGDPAGERGFALGRQTAASERIRRRPGAGGIDDGARQIAANAAIRRDRQKERAASPARGSRPCPSQGGRWR